MVSVTRIYGCQDAGGNRLTDYDRKVKEKLDLATRRGFPVTVPPTGDILRVVVWAFLPDSQPGNCPAGTRAMVYEIEAKGVKLEFRSFYPDVIPSARYSLPGKADWTGAVPTPTVA